MERSGALCRYIFSSFLFSDPHTHTPAFSSLFYILMQVGHFRRIHLPNLKNRCFLWTLPKGPIAEANHYGPFE